MLMGGNRVLLLVPEHALGQTESDKDPAGSHQSSLTAYTQVRQSGRLRASTADASVGKNVFQEGAKVVDCGDAPLTFLVQISVCSRRALAYET